MEENHIIETWDIFREYIPEKNRETAANHYIDFLIGNGVEVSVLEALTGYDPHLDDAIAIVVSEDQGADDDRGDEDWDEYENDEDR